MEELILENGVLRRDPVKQGTYCDNNVITPFKGRTINIDKPIIVYRNLTREGKVYSIKQGSLVVAHTTAICIREPEFIVSPSGKRRALKEMRRNVHAYIKGMYDTDGMGTSAHNNDLPAHIKYKPFNKLGFYCDNLTTKPFEVIGATFCIINKDGVRAAYTTKK